VNKTYDKKELENKFAKLVFYIEKQIPKFQLCSKENSVLMRFLSVILFFNKGFMTKYITTLYPRVYVPKLPWDSHTIESRIGVLAHEYVHLKDRKRWWWLFDILYAAPQIFALLSIGAIWNLWWLLALLFLLPLPSPGRAWLEFRAYKVTIALHWHLTGTKPSVPWLRDQFVRSYYYWMWPFKKSVERHILNVIENVESGEFLSPEVLEILEVLEIGD